MENKPAVSSQVIYISFIMTCLLLPERTRRNHMGVFPPLTTCLLITEEIKTGVCEDGFKDADFFPFGLRQSRSSPPPCTKKYKYIRKCTFKIHQAGRIVLPKRTGFGPRTLCFKRTTVVPCKLVFLWPTLQTFLAFMSCPTG